MKPPPTYLQRLVYLWRGLRLCLPRIYVRWRRPLWTLARRYLRSALTGRPLIG